VVDVGAGHGVLTRALADAGAQVLALEVDPALAAQLRRYTIAQLAPVTDDLNISFDSGFVSPFAQDHLVNGACP